MPSGNEYLLLEPYDYFEGSSLMERYFPVLKDIGEDRCHHALPELQQPSNRTLNYVLI